MFSKQSDNRQSLAPSTAQIGMVQRNFKSKSKITDEM